MYFSVKLAFCLITPLTDLLLRNQSVQYKEKRFTKRVGMLIPHIRVEGDNEKYIFLNNSAHFAAFEKPVGAFE